MVLTMAGLLLAIIIPAFMKQTDGAKIAKTKSGLEKLRTGLALYVAEKGGYPSGGEFNPLAQDLAPYIGTIPSDGFKEMNVIKPLYPCPSEPYGGWCYMWQPDGSIVSPNLPDNQAEYGYENFSKY